MCTWNVLGIRLANNGNGIFQPYWFSELACSSIFGPRDFLSLAFSNWYKNINITIKIKSLVSLVQPFILKVHLIKATEIYMQAKYWWFLRVKMADKVNINVKMYVNWSLIDWAIFGGSWLIAKQKLQGWEVKDDNCNWQERN